jgi:Ca2+-binding EF-hand superfamily protein
MDATSTGNGTAPGAASLIVSPGTLGAESRDLGSSIDATEREAPAKKIRIQSRLDSELIEHFRMISGFENSEISRLEKEFLKLTKNSDFMSREVFRSIPAIEVCPLRDRLELVFFELSTVTATSVDRANPASAIAIAPAATHADAEGVWPQSFGQLVQWFTGAGSDAVVPVDAAAEVGGVGTGAGSANGGYASGSWVVVDAENCADLLCFTDFLLALSQFNSPGMSEAKLKMCFRLQDFDGDGALVC